MPKQELRAVISADSRKFMRTMGKVKAKVAGVAKFLGAAAITGAVFSVREVQVFEKSMAEVNTIARLGKEDFAKLSGQVRELSTEFGMSHRELTGGLYQALSAGVPADNAMTFLETAAKAARAGVSDMKTSVDGITAAIDAFGLGAGDAEMVADSMFKAVEKGKLTFAQIAQNIGKTASIAAEAGVTMDDFFGIFATLSKTISAEQSMTSMKAAIIALLRPTDEMKKAFRALNVENGEALIKQKGLAGALRDVRGQTDGSAAGVVKLTGNQEALNAVLGVTGEKAQTADEILGAMANKAGSIDAAFQKMDETLDASLGRSIATIQDLAIVVGEQLAPELTKGAEAMNEFLADTENLKTLADIVKGIVAVFAALAKAILAVVQAGQKLAMLVANSKPIAALTDSLLEAANNNPGQAVTQADINRAKNVPFDADAVAASFPKREIGIQRDDAAIAIHLQTQLLRERLPQ